MTKIALGRVVRLVTDPAAASDAPVSMELMEGRTGKLLGEPSTEVDGTTGGTQFRPGDVLFGKLRPYLAKVWRADRVGAAIGDIHVYRPMSALDSRYLAYLLLSGKFIDEVNSSTHGAKMPRASWEFIRGVEVEVPELVEQVAIADFLDRETAKIDALIDKQCRLVQAARARLAGVVSRAVDPVSLSAPGPRLKHYVAGIRQGWSPQCNSWPAEAGQWAVLKVGCVNAGSFRPSENKELPADIQPRSDTVVRRGELLVSRANTRELVGSAAVVRGDYPWLMLSDKIYALRLRPGVNPVFLSLALGTRRYRDLIELEATGASSSMQNISQDTILDLPMCVPPIDVQDAVVARLEKASAATGVFVEKAERLIELAQERRAALITAAVTGHLDVAGKVA